MDRLFPPYGSLRGGRRSRLSATLGLKREWIYSKPAEDQSVKSEGMVNGVLYGLALSSSERAASALCAALRNFQGRQHSRRKDGGDQFAVGHIRISVAASERQHRLHPSVAAADPSQNSGRNQVADRATRAQCMRMGWGIKQLTLAIAGFDRYAETTRRTLVQSVGPGGRRGAVRFAEDAAVCRYRPWPRASAG
jgi:hypothetical protein